MHRLYRTMIVVTAVLVVGAGISRIKSAEEVPQSEGTQFIKQLTDRIQHLESRVSALEQQLRAQSGVVIQSHAVPIFPKAESPALPRHLPESWRQGEINGIPYYIVPLGDRKYQSSSSWNGGEKR